MNIIKIFIIALLLLASNARAALPSCPEASSQDALKEYASPKRLAAYWSEQIGRLYNAVPQLSPQEQKWLIEEQRSPGERGRRAFASQEFSILEARNSIGSIYASLKIINGELQPQQRESNTNLWAFTTYSLIDSDLSFHLDKLVKSGIIKKSDIPERWTTLAGDTFTLAESIRMAQSSLARHILICIIPQSAKQK